MILHKYKAIHTHIYKCAGVSIERAFGHEPYCHLTKLGAINKCGIETWRNYFKFSFVRNPWDRHVSLYFYMLSKPEEFEKKMKGPNFKRHLTKLLKYPKCFEDMLLGHQHVWVYDKEGINVNFLGRFENLHEDFAKVCSLIGADGLVLGHHNKTNHKHYSHYYDDELIDVVRKYASDDVNLFGYEFEDKRDCPM